MAVAVSRILHFFLDMSVLVNVFWARKKPTVCLHPLWPVPPLWWGTLSCTLHCSLGPGRHVEWQVALYGLHPSCICMLGSDIWGAELIVGCTERWGISTSSLSLVQSDIVFPVAAKLQLFLTLMRQELGFQRRSVCYGLAVGEEVS